MDVSTFKTWLGKVVDCPAEELASGSSCRSVIRRDWTTLLGWGNRNAKVAFVGGNPLYNAKSAGVHRSPPTRAAYDHAYYLSVDGFDREPFFRYHHSLLRNLRERDARLKELLPEELENFGFFTEIAFCPSTSIGGIPGDVAPRCFRKNVLSFIHQSDFAVVVALGRDASQLCVAELISSAASERTEGMFHGLLFRGHAGGPSVVTSYHPNFHGAWPRTKVADRLFELFDRDGVDLA